VQRGGSTPLRGPESKSGVENRSISFQCHSCFEVQARSNKQNAKKGMQKLLLDHQATSKQLEAKCQQQNVSYNWILTITWSKLDDFLALRSKQVFQVKRKKGIRKSVVVDLNSTCFEVKASVVNLLGYRCKIGFTALDLTTSSVTN